MATPAEYMGATAGPAVWQSMAMHDAERLTAQRAFQLWTAAAGAHKRQDAGGCNNRQSSGGLQVRLVLQRLPRICVSYTSLYIMMMGKGSSHQWLCNAGCNAAKQGTAVL